MFDLTRAVGPTSLAPRFDTSTVAPPQGPAEPTPPPPLGSGRKNDALGRNEFLQLLVAQMKNQDPLNPMDGQEMAAQLAQFSQVEQLIDINSSLKTVAQSQVELGLAIEDLTGITVMQGDAMARLLEQSMAINTVGKTGVMDGNQLFIDRNGNGPLTIDAGGLRGIGRITLLDAEGRMVHQGVVDGVRPGLQTLDLADFNLEPPPPAGQYTYRFEVTNDTGIFTPARTYTTGRITGLRYEQGQPMLLLGDALSVPFAALVQLRP
jgi:flagellar basal-body rod modification protein FlgD